MAADVACAGQGAYVLDRCHGASFRFEGVLGKRVRRNVDHWLLVAPKNNPGLLDMFARRDSGQKPDLVPWAGEFVGKYLISGVQALRMSDDPRLRTVLADVVARLTALQADDGYLGPWPKHERLLGHWDLWGHYHVMLGLMLWHEHTGDAKALAACRRAADLACNTYLGGKRRVYDAGSHEMNMSAIHGLARLHRKTGEPRYLRMAEEILKDFERAGDYFRTGLKGVEFHRTPKPRWESLHALQGMVELYRITGDDRYRRSFLHHWASIRRWDLRNTGGFSSGEKATGNPFRNDAIETCCVVAWMAVQIDALRLTGDPTIADDLEVATLNATAGAQHSSGAWCTYNTPMDGKRDPSHVSIRFQARADTPHLNCCSVNGPRGLGMLSEWAVMKRGADVVVNYYGPMAAQTTLANGAPVALRVEGSYPIGNEAIVTVDVAKPTRFRMLLRIPAWSAATTVAVNGEAVEGGTAGRYLTVERTWQRGDRVAVSFDFGLRYAAGDLEQLGNASFYRGPLLLAWDPRFHKVDAKAVPPLDVDALDEAKAVPVDAAIAEAAGEFPPWLVVDVPAADGKSLRLCDFASAGATRGPYRSWLPAAKLAPPAPVPWKPRDGARLPKGRLGFCWRAPAAEDQERKHTVLISDAPTFEHVVVRSDAAAGRWLALSDEQAARLKPNTTYYWKIIAANARGRTESIAPHKSFAIDPSLPPGPSLHATPYGERPGDKAVTLAPLAGDLKPAYGKLLDAQGWKPAPGPDGKPNTAIELDGTTGLVRYELAAFPETDFTIGVWVNVLRLPKTNYGQVFSAWCRGMDDPLRLVVHQGKLDARIEAGKFHGTDGWPVKLDAWTHVAAVKQGARLTLYINGKPLASTAVPERVVSMAHDFALGGNPHYGGAEFLACRLAALSFHARALSAKEIQQLHRSIETK
ncbi:glycoside hydrolase family 127 protein [bacterium]|nr:glycoside hydrolase family 127 protein [bacterium]